MCQPSSVVHIIVSCFVAFTHGSANDLQSISQAAIGNSDFKWSRQVISVIMLTIKSQVTCKLEIYSRKCRNRQNKIYLFYFQSFRDRLSQLEAINIDLKAYKFLRQVVSCLTSGTVKELQRMRNLISDDQIDQGDYQDRIKNLGT